jgi:hypothetical protein
LTRTRFPRGAAVDFVLQRRKQQSTRKVVVK